MANLYNVDSPINREQRKNINDTFADILSRFTNLQMQINILSGESSVEEILAELTNAINSANVTIEDIQVMAELYEAKLTEIEMVITNANNATSETITAINDARQAITDINNLLASITFKGEYNASTTYNANNIVRYGKSSYVSLKTQTGFIPIDDGVNWGLIAMGGTDGTGAVSTVNNVEPNEQGNVFLLPENIDAAKKHWLDITEFGAVLDSDSSDAIQAAIDFANVGDVVFTPNGVFILDKTIRHKPGVKLYGAASSSVLKSHMSIKLINSSLRTNK